MGFTQCHPGHPPFRKGVDESAALLRHYLGNDSRSWLGTLWFLNIAIENPYYINGGFNGKMWENHLFLWAIFHGYVNVYQRVYAMGDYAIGRIPQKNMFIFAALLFISHCVSHYYVHDDTGIFDINVLHPTNLLIYMWDIIVLVLFQNIHFTYLYPQCLLDTFIPTMWPPPVLFVALWL